MTQIVPQKVFSSPEPKEFAALPLSFKWDSCVSTVANTQDRLIEPDGSPNK